MLLWIFAGVSFLACLVAWHLKQGLTKAEAAGLFIATSVSFAAQLDYLYTKNTTDHKFVSGYTTSLVYRPSYTYKSGDKRRHEPAHWLLEQSPYPPKRIIQLSRNYTGHVSGLVEHCYGECYISYPSGEPKNFIWHVADLNNFPVYLIDAHKNKFERTQPGEPSVVKVPYYNPVMASDDVVFSTDESRLPYFKIINVNRGERLIAPNTTEEQNLKLEHLNAEMASRSNISIGLIVTTTRMYFEQLKRAWHKGKSNDFVVVVYAPDGKTIRNVDVLAWGNYNLVQNVKQGLASLGDVNIDAIIDRLAITLKQGLTFQPHSFEKLNFLKIKIPMSDYLFIISYQVILMLYLLTLLNLDPSTKTQKAEWREVAKTWQKRDKPNSWRYYLHPFSMTGMFFMYTLMPFLFFRLWEKFF